MKIGPIIDEILGMREINFFNRLLIQPIGDDPPQSPRAVAGEMGELSEGIAFKDPVSKPDNLSMSLNPSHFPNIGFIAWNAPIPLFSQARVPVPLNIMTMTNRTVLFFASYRIYH